MADLPQDIDVGNLIVDNGRVIKRHTDNSPLRYTKSSIREYRKMEADPTLFGILRAIFNIASIVTWTTEAVEKDDSDEDFDAEKASEYRKFVHECLNDMPQSMHDLSEAAMDMLPIGFSVVCPQFKIRAGDDDNSLARSKYSDKRIGWKSFKVIDQESIDQWDIDDGQGFVDLKGLIQARRNGKKEHIPRDRFLVFRSTSKLDSPEGESILYGAHRTYKGKERVSKIEEVSLERNLEGIPVAKLPSGYMRKDASADQKQVVAYMKHVVTHVKFNEQTGIVLPSDTDEQGNPLVDLSLMTAGSNMRLDACRKVITDKEHLMAQSLLASFIKLGTSTGSYALSSDQTDMFLMSMKTYLSKISEVFNREAIPQLMRLNGMDLKYAPKIEFSGLEKKAVREFVELLSTAVEKGLVVATDKTQRAILDKMDVTTEGADEQWERVEELRERTLQASQNQASEDPDDPEENEEGEGAEDDIDPSVLGR